MRISWQDAKRLGVLEGTARVGSPCSGRMNKTESIYAGYLDTRKIIGDIVAWQYESIKLRLADRTWYTPDFVVYFLSGNIEFHEVKGGFIRDDAKVKFKVAVETFPFFDFVLAQRIKGEWKINDYKHGMCNEI